MRLYLLHASYENVEGMQKSVDDPHRFLQIFAKTTTGQTVILTVKDWLPYAYIKVPADVKQKTSFEKQCREKFWKVASSRIVKLKQFVGFTNLKSREYVQLRFKKWPVWDKENKLLESKVKPQHKFFHETGLRSGAWFEVEDAMLQQELVDWTEYKCHYMCQSSSLRPCLDDATPPALTVMAYDLETSGLDPKTCGIYQVCLVFWNTADRDIPETGQDPRSVVICTQPTAEVHGTRVMVVADEKALMVAMKDHIQKHDPDIAVGYNLQFDNKMLMERSKRYTDFTVLAETGRIKVPAYFQISTISSAALGTNERVLWHVPGRWVLDLFLYAKANIPGMPNYKLDTVGKQFLKEGKVDIPWGTILQGFADEDAVDLRGEIANYCEIDGRLCLQLVKHWSAHISCLEEASVSCVNASTIVDTGRQCKVVGLLQGEMYGEYIFNTPSPAADSGYVGATVIDTHRGYYGKPDQQVILLDFASLYPSLMITHGVCPSRYVRRDMADEVAASKEEGVTIVAHQITPTTSVQLATPSHDQSPPVFSRILQKLLDGRAAVRRFMKTITDQDQLSVLECRQKAKKVACNSAYGILGTTSGMLPLPELAAVTTYTGRNALMFSKGHAESQYGAFVVGGDTDSIFFTLPHPTPVPEAPDAEWMNERMKYVFERANTIAVDITARLAEMYPPRCKLVMEFEGVMYPSLYLKKKHYAAELWNPVRPGQDPVPQKDLKIKGLVAVRNDWSLLTKHMAQDALNMSIRQRNPEGALLRVRETLMKMRKGELAISEFIISKQLHSYDPKTRSPHVTMCQRIKAKEAAAAPVLGTKVSYVIRRGPEDISDRAYPPEEVSPTEIDYDFYFERQVLKPLTGILGPLIDGGEAKLRRMLKNEHTGQQEMPDTFTRSSPEREREPSATAPPSAKKAKTDIKCADIASMFEGTIRAAAPVQKQKAVAKKKSVQIKCKDIKLMFGKK